MKECPTCKRTGRVAVRLLGGVVGRCPICRGAGVVDVECSEPMCRGGVVQYPEWEGETQPCPVCTTPENVEEPK